MTKAQTLILLEGLYRAWMLFGSVLKRVITEMKGE